VTETAASRRPGARRPRSDASRNRERLLAAAGQVFRERSVDAALNEVARRAEVGAGTLYRHFPTRGALVEALIREESAALCRRGEELADSPDPVAALATWLRAYVDHATRYRGLAESLRAAAAADGDRDGDAATGDSGGDHGDHGADPVDPLADCVSRVQAVGDRLVDRAHAAGRMRADVTSADAFDLAAAVAWISEQGPRDARQRERLLSLVLEVITARSPGRAR
jgi:AcrR family transcriptional regulator